jgi:hypothetical protein
MIPKPAAHEEPDNHEPPDHVYNTDIQEQLIMDSGSMYHMMNKSHQSMTEITTSHKQAVFGNDQRLPITLEADLGQLKRIQLCKGMSKQLLSVSQLSTANGMVSIFTETGCYTMKPSFKLKMSSDEIAFFSPLTDGLYTTSLGDLFTGMGMHQSK